MKKSEVLDSIDEVRSNIPLYFLILTKVFWQHLRANTSIIDAFFIVLYQVVLMVGSFLILPDHQGLVETNKNLSRGVVDQDTLHIWNAFLLAENTVHILLKHVQVHGTLFGSELGSFPLLHA